MSILTLDEHNHVATITINSPPANALSSSLLFELNETLNALFHNQAIKTILIKGEGKFFSAGADIKEFTALQGEGAHEELSRKGQDVFRRLEKFPVPVIAAVHGAALGGGLELAMACDMRIVGKSAKLGLPELTLGIIPGFAGTQRLTQLVGHAKAYEMILTGEPISGQEAATIGLANHAVENEHIFSEAEALAEKMAAKSKPTIEKVMSLVPYAKVGDLQEGIDEEAKAFGDVFQNEDAAEGIQAFIEKREPHFKDQ